MKYSRHFFFSIACFVACAGVACTQEQDLGDAKETRCFEGVEADGAPAIVWGVGADPVVCEDDPREPSGCADNDEDTLCLNPFMSENDGQGPSSGPCEIDPDGDGHVLTDHSCPGTVTPPFGLDCDENDTSIHASSAEACDGIDQDCDDAIDEGLACDAEVVRLARADLLEALPELDFLDVAIDSNGDQYAAGYELAFDENVGTFVITSSDAQGQLRWEHRLVVHRDRDRLPETPVDLFGEFSVALVADAEHLYMLAHTALLELPEGSPLPEVRDVFVAAIDLSDGHFVWIAPLDWNVQEPWGDFNGEHIGTSFAIARVDDGLIINAPVYGDDDAFGTTVRYARLDLEGGIEWTRGVDRQQRFEEARSLALAAQPSGELFLAGGTYPALLWDACALDANSSFVVALDASGRCRWSITVDVYKHAFKALAPAPDGGVYVAGTFGDTVSIDRQTIIVDRHPPVSGEQAFIMHLDAQGELKWIYNYDEGSIASDIVDIAVDGEGNPHATLALPQRLSGLTGWPNVSDEAIGRWIGFVSALSVTGEELWSRDATPEGEEPASLGKLAVGPQGEILTLDDGQPLLVKP